MVLVDVLFWSGTTLHLELLHLIFLLETIWAQYNQPETVRRVARQMRIQGRGSNDSLLFVRLKSGIFRWLIRQVGAQCWTTIPIRQPHIPSSFTITNFTLLLDVRYVLHGGRRNDRNLALCLCWESVLAHCYHQQLLFGSLEVNNNVYGGVGWGCTLQWCQHWVRWNTHMFLLPSAAIKAHSTVDSILVLNVSIFSFKQSRKQCGLLTCVSI